jgi:hypothetical protein
MGHTLAKAARDFPGGGMAGASWDVDELSVLPMSERSGVWRSAAIYIQYNTRLDLQIHDRNCKVIWNYRIPNYFEFS